MKSFRRVISFEPFRKRTPKMIVLKEQVRTHPKEKGILQKTLQKLKVSISPIVSILPIATSSEPEKPTNLVSRDNFFKKLDEPLRFVFKVPFVKNFYLLWLKKEGKELNESLENKFYYVFLGELSFYGKLGIETFERLCLINYPEIVNLDEFRENLIILHHLATRNRNHIEETLYNLERTKESDEERDQVPCPLSTRNYYKYIDLNVRPLFKFEAMQLVFGRWLKLESLNLPECFEASYHNLFIEELLYYHDQGEGFLKSILKSIYIKDSTDYLCAEDINTIYTLIRTFDTILEETVRRMKESHGEGKEIERKQFLDHGYDFGMILYYVATKDAFSALVTARGLVVDAAAKILDKKRKHQELEQKI